MARLHRQRSRDRQTLLLASGKIKGEGVELLTETDMFELFFRHRSGIRFS